MNRNRIFAALFALTADMQVGAIVGTPVYRPLVSRSRKFKHFDKVPPGEQPAFFQTEHTEATAEKTGMPPLRKLSGAWTVYCASDPGDQTDQATVWINDWLDAFDARIAPPPGQSKQTLGGLVHHAFIDGSTIKVPGDDDGQGMLVVPISILVP